MEQNVKQIYNTGMEESLFSHPKEADPQKDPVRDRSSLTTDRHNGCLASNGIYTISQITSLIKTSLENSLPGKLTITGEISSFKRHSSGHCYFDLKDENSVLPVVMWKSSFTRLKFEPENGLAVLANGHIDVYAPAGKYQFYAESMIPAGIGALQLAFEQMKNKLAAEGLFDEKNKKPLPKYPFRIGILTSKSGAALHDIADSIYNRWPPAELLFYDVPVQGQGAAEKIAAAVKDINRRNAVLKIDTLIVGRGGGSMEDLWAFNEEAVARAIFASKIPVISAVGHEVDVTIADLVADARASTPTKAGVIAVPDINEVLAQIDYFAKDIKDKLRWTMQLGTQRLDELSFTLSDFTRDMLAAIRAKLGEFAEKVLQIEPHRLLADRKISLNNASSRMSEKISRIFSDAKGRLETQAGRLSACSPKSVLNRGYSITKNPVTGKVITSPADINIGDLLITELKNENMFESRVTKK